MFNALHRLMHRGQAPAMDLSWLDGWVRKRGDRLKRVRGGEGFVIEGSHEGHPLRMEWGPPQRAYLSAAELRVRWELGLPLSLEMLVLTRGLADLLEAEAYDNLTSDQQTAIETAMPEEGRWLAMYERLSADQMPPGTHGRFVAIGAHAEQTQTWLEGELGSRLSRAHENWLGDAPLVMMTLRGRLYLRTEASEIDLALMDGLRGVADLAAQRALALAAAGARTRRHVDGS